MNSVLKEQIIRQIAAHATEINSLVTPKEKVEFIYKALNDIYPKVALTDAANNTLKMIEYQRRLDIEHLLHALHAYISSGELFFTNDGVTNEVLKNLKTTFSI